MRWFTAAFLVFALPAVPEPFGVATVAADESLHAERPEGERSELEHADVAAAEAGPTGKPVGGEHGGRNYNMPPLDFEPQLAVWTLVLFLVFLWVARRFAWEPLMKGLNAREARINRALAEAQAARAQAEELLREYDQRIAGTHDEVRGILGAARREAERSKVEIIKAAEIEAEQIRERAVGEIVAAREQLLAEMSPSVDAYAETTASRMLESR
ncbi:MAG TPA: ATP synthase F0 subunit B [Planctomycetaceae bacterium]|nr:ATP synthase F0 subunit B [Planctomycetaceae bacterium]